jgi:hypothetical protein
MTFGVAWKRTASDMLRKLVWKCSACAMLRKLVRNRTAFDLLRKLPWKRTALAVRTRRSNKAALAAEDTRCELIDSFMA